LQQSKQHSICVLPHSLFYAATSALVTKEHTPLFQRRLQACVIHELQFPSNSPGFDRARPVCYTFVVDDLPGQ
jgi:hypothetical protein